MDQLMHLFGPHFDIVVAGFEVLMLPLCIGAVALGRYLGKNIEQEED